MSNSSECSVFSAVCLVPQQTPLSQRPFWWASCHIRKIAGLCMHRDSRGYFTCRHGLAIPTCITARARRTCRGACRDRKPAVSFEVGGGENVPGIPGACATRNFPYLVRSPWVRITGCYSMKRKCHQSDDLFGYGFTTGCHYDHL